MAVVDAAGGDSCDMLAISVLPADDAGPLLLLQVEFVVGEEVTHKLPARCSEGPEPVGGLPLPYLQRQCERVGVGVQYILVVDLRVEAGSWCE